MRFNVVTEQLEDVGMPIRSCREIVLSWFNDIDKAMLKDVDL